MRSVQSAGASIEQILDAGRQSIEILSRLSLDLPPNVLTSRTLIPVLKGMGLKDPYIRLKEKEINIGNSIYPRLKKLITSSKDRLRCGCLVAATGNIIDIGAQQNYDIEKSVEEIGKIGFKIDHFKQFIHHLKPGHQILYILDNTGELFFDRILIEELSENYKITAVVKERPIHNDATEKEARSAGIERFARIITSGDGSLGIDWDKSGKEFLEAYRSADLVIGKGHANYESLIDGERDCFLILKAKCPVVAEKLGVDIGDLVFYYYQP